jgi:hypothetical protein
MVAEWLDSTYRIEREELFHVFSNARSRPIGLPWLVAAFLLSAATGFAADPMPHCTVAATPLADDGFLATGIR